MPRKYEVDFVTHHICYNIWIYSAPQAALKESIGVYYAWHVTVVVFSAICAPYGLKGFRSPQTMR